MVTASPRVCIQGLVRGFVLAAVGMASVFLFVCFRLIYCKFSVVGWEVLYVDKQAQPEAQAT